MTVVFANKNKICTHNVENQIGMEMSFFSHELNKDGNILIIHVHTIFIHINGIWPSWLCLRVWINFSRTKFPWIFSFIFFSLFSLSLISEKNDDKDTKHRCVLQQQTHLILDSNFIKKNATYKNTDLQKKFISFQALRCCTANKRCNCSPLCRH